jgi:hypothetical protein
LHKNSSLARAGQWFLDSGIQEPSGGVARFYQSDIRKNKPISTEITGYTASALVYLFTVTGDQIYLDRARQTVQFLVKCVWNQDLRTFPFEYPSDRTYFFDCGIIIRGLLAVWHQTKEEELLAVAHSACRGMIGDFRAESGYHPTLELPGKEPVARTPHWSRSSACYQLKSAMAWLDTAELTGDESLRSAYTEMLELSLADHAHFLSGADTYGTMDRLHAYGYFLEALTPVLDRPECAAAFSSALESVSRNFQEISPTFARCDALAQLVRARIYGGYSVPDAEIDALAAFQVTSEDPRIDGGFLFGHRDGQPSPHVSPVSTAFALQALEMAGNQPPCRYLLI